MKLWFREYFHINYWSIALTDHWLTESHDFIMKVSWWWPRWLLLQCIVKWEKRKQRKYWNNFPFHLSLPRSKNFLTRNESQIQNDRKLHFESQYWISPKSWTRSESWHWAISIEVAGVSLFFYSVTVFDSAIPWLLYTAGCEKLYQITVQ